jgi:hypothetical protein
MINDTITRSCLCMFSVTVASDDSLFVVMSTYVKKHVHRMWHKEHLGNSYVL